MAPVFFPTAYQVEMRGSYFGQLVENVFHCIGPDPFDPGPASGIAGAFQVFAGELLTDLSQDYTVNEIHVHNLAGVDSGEFTLGISPPQAGGEANPGLPGNVSFCISLRTALAGRSTRGRKYIVGLPETAVTGNTYDADHIAAHLVAFANLLDALSFVGAPLAVFSKTIPALTTVVTAVAVDNVVDSQRRRLTGRGR